MTSEGSLPRCVDAVIVGAGFAGLYALHALRVRGLRAHVIEVGDDVGGTWYWNRYPGARCDIASVDYCYSFDPDLQQEWTWSERYAAQPEILRYIEHVTDRYDLRRDISFNTRVISATYDEEAKLWTLVTDHADQIGAPICVMATGALSNRRLPPYEGIETFAGDIVHPGDWPREHDVTLDHQRVGIVGTGSTGVQMTTSIAARVAHLYVFQRTPNYVIPAHNRPLTAIESDAVKANYVARRAESRRARRGFPVPDVVTSEPFDHFAPPEQRRRLWALWGHGGLIFTSGFGDLQTNPDANRAVADFVRERIHEAVRDPQVAERLSPRDYPLGGKRPCVDTGYYDTFNRDNVTLVDLRSTPIVRFERDGLRTTTERIALDTILLATGYDAITGSLNAIEIRGRDGLLLRDKWAEGPSALLGLCTSGFPNLFMITGPGSPSVLANMVLSIEQHVDLMVSLLDHGQRVGCPVVEADEEAEANWAAHVAEIVEGTAALQGNSWFLGANVPGKPRVFMPYAAGLGTFIDECQAIAERGYKGFSFAPRPATTPS